MYKTKLNVVSAIVWGHRGLNPHIFYFNHKSLIYYIIIITHKIMNYAY